MGDCGSAEGWILAGLEKQCSGAQGKFVHVCLLLPGKLGEYGQWSYESTGAGHSLQAGLRFGQLSANLSPDRKSPERNFSWGRSFLAS